MTIDRKPESRHRALWALGNYTRVAIEVVAALGPVPVEAGGIGPGGKVLDIAPGDGNAANPAAQAGANVTADDLAGQRQPRTTPGLVGTQPNYPSPSEQP